jgi:hypothetical protein
MFTPGDQSSPQGARLKTGLCSSELGRLSLFDRRLVGPLPRRQHCLLRRSSLARARDLWRVARQVVHKQGDRRPTMKFAPRGELGPRGDFVP